MQKIQFTKDGLKKLQEEYEDLIKNKKHQAVQRLQSARAMGDLSENSEYTAAKEDLAFVEGRSRELEEILKNAEVIEEHTDHGIVEIGTKIIIEKNGLNEEYHLVGQFEADPSQKKLSSTSPIGKALMGKKKGQEVTVTVPAGKIIYKIIDIQKE